MSLELIETPISEVIDTPKPARRGMKIEITFDEIDNEFADVTIDGQTVRMTTNEMNYGETAEDSIGRAILSKLFDVVPDIISIRGYQEGRPTWAKLDEITLEAMDADIY